MEQSRQLTDLFHEAGIVLDTQTRCMWDYNIAKMSHDLQKDLGDYVIKNMHKGMDYVAQQLMGKFFGGDPEAPCVPVGVAMMIRGFKVEPRVITVEAPVHGPFEASCYDDPEFVRVYTESRYETRVADIEGVLTAIEDTHIIAPGDGVGVVYRAVQNVNMRGRNFTVSSSDPSEHMCNLGKRLGNEVTCEDFDSVMRRHDDAGVVIASHLTDYLTPRQIGNLAMRPTIIFGRALTFPLCYKFRPYSFKWGFQLCSSHIRLKGFIPVSELKIAHEVDYTVFSVDPHVQGHVAIDHGLESYVMYAALIGFRTRDDEHTRAVITLRPFKFRHFDAIVPFVGNLGEYTASSYLVVPPLSAVGFFSARRLSHIPWPHYIGKKFFCEAEAVWLETDGVLHKLVPRQIDGVDYYTHRSGHGCVRIDGCQCYGSHPHSHLLRVIKQRYVEWSNVVASAKRHGGGRATRQQIQSTFYASIGEISTARFEHMERVNRVLYTNDGYIDE